MGGGAYTIYTETNGGGYLTESRPDWNTNTWIASSKDHAVSDLHSIDVYAVGLKIQGVSAATLRSVMTVVKSPLSSQLTSPTNSASVSSPYVLIGGGAKVTWSGYGNLLIYSYPTYNSWNVGSKDHIYVNYARIEAWAIGIQNYIPGFGNIDIAGTFGPEGSNSTNTGNLQTCCYFASYAPACSGALSTYSGAGRLLTGMRPQYYSWNGGGASSKDLQYASAGSLFYYLTSIRKRP